MLESCSVPICLLRTSFATGHLPLVVRETRNAWVPGRAPRVASGEWQMALLKSSGSFVVDDVLDLGHGPVELVVEDHVVERPAALGHVDLALGGAEALADVVG